MTLPNWKDLLADRMAPALAEEIDVYETQIELRRQGKLDEKIFAETRLRRGAYGQRYDNGQRHDGIETRMLSYPSGELTKGPSTLFDAPGMQRIKIPFGVVTAGIYSRTWKVEGSVFNGREPDEQRTNIDVAPWDSFSGRLSVAPSSGLVLQVSAGHLREAEAGLGTQPRTDKNRFTTSASYHRGSSDSRVWATTIAYGLNRGRHVEAAGVGVIDEQRLEPRVERHRSVAAREPALRHVDVEPLGRLEPARLPDPDDGRERLRDLEHTEQRGDEGVAAVGRGVGTHHGGANKHSRSGDTPEKWIGCHK